MTEIADSRIVVLESSVRGQRFVIRREAVVAFIASSPRGPVGIPVAIRTVDEYQRRFGAPGHRNRVQDILAQFFENGGTNAIFVRVSASARRHRIIMRGPAGHLILHAVNPGPYECLRASIDYDGVPSNDDERFNLVIHRLASRDRPIVKEQEIYRAVSIDPGDADFVTHSLVESRLAFVGESAPLARPDITRCRGLDVGAAYEYADDDWHDNSALTDYDLIGCNTEGTGIFALDRVPIVDLICPVPDAGDIGPVALYAAERYCQARQALMFVDPPANWVRVADVVRDRLSSAFSSPNVATYFPRPETVPGTGLNRSPSVLGALMGRFVADEVEHGAWGARRRGILDIRCRARLACVLNDHDEAALHRLGVNSLRHCGGHMQAAGLVTMNRSRGFNAQGSDLRLRRLALFVIGSISRGTRWATFADVDTDSIDELHRQIKDFMEELYVAGALSGPSSKEAWYFYSDRDLCGVRITNDNATSDEPPVGVSFTVGFALRDGETLAFRFAHDHLDCRVQSVGCIPGVALAS